MKNSKWFKQLAYRFDNVMAKGVVSLVGLLFVATFVVIVLVSAVVTFLGLFPPEEEFSFFEVMWLSLMRTLDAGTMGGDQGDTFRIAMLVITLCGVIIVASLIGVVSNAFDEKVASLRKGRSQVLETGHTLILGWNSKIFTILQELEIANQSRKRPVIVIMANRDKVEIEDDIADKLGRDLKTKLIVRSGDPISATDLQIVNPEKARSIVILASDTASDSDADSASIKTCLALLKIRDAKKPEYHIVGEIRDEANLEAAYMVGGDEAHWVLGGHLLSRIIVQTCRQSGLSMVFTELLDFAGAEIYISPQPTLIGMPYREALTRFTHGSVLGIINQMKVTLNPDRDYVLQAGDDILVVAEDDSLVAVASQAPEVDEGVIQQTSRPAPKPERTLILGTNENINDVLREMATYMAPGSQVRVVAEAENVQLAQFDSLAIDYRKADTTSSTVLGRLEVETFDHIVVLADRERYAPEQGDARTLLTLLHLRDIGRKAGVKLSIVSEMLDDRNAELAENTHADDFIVSDKLVSLMMTQIEESPEVSHVFKPLLSSDETQLRLNPIEWYVATDKPVDFETLIVAAMRSGESAIGVSVQNERESDQRMYGIRLNPSRSQKVTYRAGDRLIVLANVR